MVQALEPLRGVRLMLDNLITTSYKNLTKYPILRNFLGVRLEMLLGTHPQPFMPAVWVLPSKGGELKIPSLVGEGKGEGACFRAAPLLTSPLLGEEHE